MQNVEETVLTYRNLPDYQRQMQRFQIPEKQLNLHNYMGKPVIEVQKLINIIRLERRKYCR